MTVLTPPGYQQAQTYDAVKDRLYLNTSRFYKLAADNSKARSGILPDTDAWSAPISAVGLNATIGPFRAVISNNFAANAGDYIMTSVANETRAVGASTATTNRQDIIGVQVLDQFYAGGVSSVDIVVVPGTATAGTPADPALPLGFMPLYRLAMPANATTPTITDLRQRTAEEGALIPVFANQVGQTGVRPGEMRLLPASGVMPQRVIVWGADGAWHAESTWTVDFNSWLFSSSTADRQLAGISFPDPGYPYKLGFTGNITTSYDPGGGFSFNVRDGATATGTILGAPASYQNRQAAFSGALTLSPGGVTGVLTGARLIAILAQRNFGSGTQGLAVAAPSSVSIQVIPA